MYHLLASAIKGLLVATGSFGDVVCGSGKGDSFPMASVWLDKGMPNSPLTETAHFLVQVQSFEADDTEAAYLRMLELLWVAREALHDAQLPGKGAKRLVAKSIETRQIRETGEMIYVLPVSVIFDPAGLSTT